MKRRINDFINENGKSISAVNPGSDEKALSVNDSLEAIRLFQEYKMPIAGGDVLTMIGDNLIYAYQKWGSEYHALNWYCNKTNNESQDDYLRRSHELAIESIENADHVAKHLEDPCLIVLVF